MSRDLLVQVAYCKLRLEFLFIAHNSIVFCDIYLQCEICDKSGIKKDAFSTVFCLWFLSVPVGTCFVWRVINLRASEPCEPRGEPCESCEPCEPCEPCESCESCEPQSKCWEFLFVTFIKKHLTENTALFQEQIHIHRKTRHQSNRFKLMKSWTIFSHLRADSEWNRGKMSIKNQLLTMYIELMSFQVLKDDSRQCWRTKSDLGGSSVIKAFTISWWVESYLKTSLCHSGGKTCPREETTTGSRQQTDRVFITLIH